MANEWFPRLRGTLLSYFGIGGSSGFVLKNSSGTAEFRNVADDAYADLRSKKLKILGTNAANGITLDAPAAMGAGITFVLPGTDGATDQVLKTNGSGTLSWTNQSSGADVTAVLEIDEGTSSPATLLVPDDDTRLKQWKIVVGVAAGGGSPTLQIGVSGTPALYVAAADVDLKTAGVYIINVDEDLGTDPDDIIITITPSSQTFTVSVSVSYIPA